MGNGAEPIKVPPVVAPPVKGLAMPRDASSSGRMAVAARRVAVVAVVVGGWMKDQTTRTLQPALAHNGIWTVSPTGWNDWKHDIAELARRAIRDTRAAGADDVRLAMIGHSFGAQAVGDAVCELAREGIYPGYVGLIDPVSPKMGFPRPIAVDTCFCSRGTGPGVLRVYYRIFPFGPIRANIVDASGRKVATLWRGCRRIWGTHNSMCHQGSVIDEIVRDVRRIAQG
jgi:hypothetical protein